MSENIIEFKQVTKYFSDKAAVCGLDLPIRRGELFVLVGASGSGKSTTLKMINALVAPDEGDVYFDGRRIKDYDIRALRHRIGYVLQQIALFPAMTVRQNIELMPDILGWRKSERRSRAESLLEMVGLPPTEYLGRYPHELSGGEQQRVGILRAIAARPAVLLMDEAFSALDPLSRTALQDILLDIHRQNETTIVFVTHNMHEALRLGDRIGVMRDGALVQNGRPSEIQNRPADDFVRAMFEQEQATPEQVLAAFERLNPQAREVVRRRINQAV
ncbi:ATP-binding cassette domain-containing protein [Neisseria chenwenguii]|uniref:ATP-binding cassette domain-containing protein n=1 Tax=Neisseria chenwenguii TaxID=1853278 RepID=UPI000F4EE1AD|nr:ABC transporter ATP-binding protein [Neisseria chenwenguii]ROV55823.1 ABC transporter ATP-binding protein [Neisseria chenwenguii]